MKTLHRKAIFILAIFFTAQAQALEIRRADWFQATVLPMTRYFCTTDNPFRQIFTEPEIECATTVVILMQRCHEQAIREGRIPPTLKSETDAIRAGEEMGTCVYLTYKNEKQTPTLPRARSENN